MGAICKAFSIWHKVAVFATIKGNTFFLGRPQKFPPLGTKTPSYSGCEATTKS